jgi:hypothetical protein
MALQLGDSAGIDEAMIGTTGAVQAHDEAEEADEGEVHEFSSPACSMHEASDQYMGYADPNEVTAFLNGLLEAERAGARVTLESARAAGNGQLAELLRSIQRDEARSALGPQIDGSGGKLPISTKTL